MKINQVLWVIDNKTQTIVPVKIVEKVTKETLEGSKTEFIVQTPANKKANLNSVDGKSFESLNEAKKFLLDSAQELVSSIIQRAQMVAEKVGFFHAQEEIQSDIIEPEINTDDFITLPDGRLAKVKVKMPEIT